MNNQPSQDYTLKSLYNDNTSLKRPVPSYDSLDQEEPDSYHNIKRVRTNKKIDIINTSYRNKNNTQGTTINDLKLSKHHLDKEFVSRYLDRVGKGSMDGQKNAYSEEMVRKLVFLENEMWKYNQSRNFYN
jgi:hypothetical protein